MDLFFLLFRQQKQVEKQFLQDNVNLFFKAADMDGNGTLDLQEFITFLRPIDPMKFNKDHLIDIFFKETKKVPQDRPTLNIQQFCWLIMEQEGLTRLKIEIFLLVDDEIDEEDHVNKLRKTWFKYKRDQLWAKYQSFDVWDDDFQGHFDTIDSLLDGLDEQSEKERKFTCKIIWILYRILNVEVYNRRIDKDLVEIIPMSLLSLTNWGDNMNFRINKQNAINKEKNKHKGAHSNCTSSMMKSDERGGRT